MWKDYSASYIKNNKAASVTIIISVLVATMFLSFICSLFYNFWMYDIEQIRQEEGGWHGRLVGNISDTDIEGVQNFANVTRVETYPNKNGQMTADIYFENMRRTYNDLPQIVQQLEIINLEITYHDTLLSQYFIYDPQDEQPPMLLLFFLFVMLVSCVSLVLMIRNAFAASMSARIHQLGILTSIGATPRQIKICLIQEAFALGIIPINLSTKYTYFERYKNSWDVMATVKNTDMDECSELPELVNLEGVKSCVAYQKAMAYTTIGEEAFSSQLLELGGMASVVGSSVTMEHGW